MKKDFHNVRGFTLVELIITIAVVAIILGFAIPSFRDLIMNNRISMGTHDFADIIQFARSEALRIGDSVTVDATDSSNGSNEWGGGVTVWYDASGNGSMEASEVLRVLQAFTSGMTLDSDGFDSFQFLPTGETSFSGAASEDLTLCDGRTGETGRKIELLGSGLIRVTTTPCS